MPDALPAMLYWSRCCLHDLRAAPPQQTTVEEANERKWLGSREHGKKITESVNKHWKSAFIKWTSVSLDTSYALYYRSAKSPWFVLRSTFILPPLRLILPMTKSPQLVLIQMVQAAEHPKLEKLGGGGQREGWKRERWKRERESPGGKNPFHICCQIWTKKIWEDILPWTEI